MSSFKVCPASTRHSRLASRSDVTVASAMPLHPITDPLGLESEREESRLFMTMKLFDSLVSGPQETD